MVNVGCGVARAFSECVVHLGDSYGFAYERKMSSKDTSSSLPPTGSVFAQNLLRCLAPLNERLEYRKFQLIDVLTCRIV
jgi:hypothetical protein